MKTLLIAAASLSFLLAGVSGCTEVRPARAASKKQGDKKEVQKKEKAPKSPSAPKSPGETQPIE